MASITFTNKNTTKGFSFTNHGGGRINLGPGEILVTEVDPLKGPYEKSYLTSFYARYSDDLEVSLSFPELSSGGGSVDAYTKTESDSLFAKAGDVYTKTESDSLFEPKTP